MNRKIPDKILEIVGNQSSYSNNVGMSDSEVLIYPDYVLKIQAESEETKNEKDIVAHYELISVDYVRNEAVMKNKENGISYTIALNKIDKNTPISADFHRNTFTDIINNG